MVIVPINSQGHTRVTLDKSREFSEIIVCKGNIELNDLALGIKRPKLVLGNP
jgi:hypothetical protein